MDWFTLPSSCIILSKIQSMFWVSSVRDEVYLMSESRLKLWLHSALTCKYKQIRSSVNPNTVFILVNIELHNFSTQSDGNFRPLSLFTIWSEHLCVIIYELLILNVVQETELQSVIQIQKSQNSFFKDNFVKCKFYRYLLLSV